MFRLAEVCTMNTMYDWSHPVCDYSLANSKI